MRRTRKAAKAIVESSDSEDDIPLKKLHKSIDNNSQTENKKADSSSESDIENYLQPINKIDLNSSFFKTRSKNEEEFENIEKKLFSGITRLSDSESDDSDTNTKKETAGDAVPMSTEIEMVESKPSTSGTKLNFQKLEEYTRQIEEARKHVEKYNAKKKSEENNLDITHLLAAGESKQTNLTLDNIKPEDLHSSDFESCDSEQEDWEEVKIKDSQEVKESSAPKKDIQIVVNMPETCKKKKGADLLAAMKRRLNRIRKENQVYVHKVHLLCWIAHGNYVNAAINNSEILGLALSLLPSDKCYPSDRTDLNYLEQVVQWYKKAVKVIEKHAPKQIDLVDSLKLQISKKEAYNKKMFVYIFVAILRALGIQCRLILSFQVEPIRPPASELHSLAKDSEKKVSENKVVKNKTDKKMTVAKDSKTTKQNEESEIKRESKSSKNSKQSKDTEIKDTKVLKTSEKNGTKDTKITSEESRTSNQKKRTVAKSQSNISKLQTKSDNKKIKAEPRDASNVKKTDESKNLTVRETKKTRSRSEGDKEKSAEKPKSKKEEKSITKNKCENQGTSKNTLNVKDTGKTRSKSEDNSDSKSTKMKPKDNTKKEIIKIKLPKKEKAKPIAQLDGINNSDEEDFCIPQLDGANDKNKKPTPKKPNLKKLHTQTETCEVKKHPSRFKPNKGYNSEDDFRSRSPSTKKHTDSPKSVPNRKVNLHKLKDIPKKSDELPKVLVSSPKKQLDVKNDIINLIKGRITEQKHIDRSRRVKKRKALSDDSDSDSDFMPEPVKKKYHDSDSDVDAFVPKPKVKKRIRVAKKETGGLKVLSSDSELEKNKKKRGNNVWAEVFLESEEKWISVDVVRGQVHCVTELFNRATHPVSYIVAWNNNNNVKDVTKRYCTNFNTVTRKLRINAKWWEETLKPFLGKYTARDKEEDDDLNRQQLDQPLPKTVLEYKNHPLYVLRRHLLKFEALYPPDVQPLGFIRGEAVYPRNCVYVCRSREIWLKEAKVVKPGEKPYKIVKARPKYDRLSNTFITDQMLEIFGIWQTTDYEPPTAENGVVPRNAFGNVELFKPSMLPKGTVHLKLAGLNKVCRRMNVDCASAIVGFDFHGGWSHPTYDGFVVCEEFADSVVAAWELEQDEIDRRENEKIEKRVYGNWKKLIKGLLIREKLKAKYDFGGAGTSSENKEKKSKGPKFCTKKR